MRVVVEVELGLLTHQVLVVLVEEALEEPAQPELIVTVLLELLILVVAAAVLAKEHFLVHQLVAQVVQVLSLFVIKP